LFSTPYKQKQNLALAGVRAPYSMVSRHRMSSETEGTPLYAPKKKIKKKLKKMKKN